MAHYRKRRAVLTTTRVGAAPVPVLRAKHISLVRFSAGEHGRGEAGDFLFWTAVLKKKRKGKGRLIGRAYAYLGPGDRFDRIKRENPRPWVELLSRGANVKHIRPSTIAEITRWMRTHAADARFVLSGLVGGKAVSRRQLRRD